jgi:hypothetical protein
MLPLSHMVCGRGVGVSVGMCVLFRVCEFRFQMWVRVCYHGLWVCVYYLGFVSFGFRCLFPD